MCMRTPGPKGFIPSRATLLSGTLSHPERKADLQFPIKLAGMRNLHLLEGAAALGSHTQGLVFKDRTSPLSTSTKTVAESANFIVQSWVLEIRVPARRNSPPRLVLLRYTRLWNNAWITFGPPGGMPTSREAIRKLAPVFHRSFRPGLPPRTNTVSSAICSPRRTTL